MVDVEFKDLCLDAVHPQRVAVFWGALLGQQVREQDGGDAQLVAGPDLPPARTVWVNGVAEAQQVKNRVHLDVRRATADVQDLLAAGATLLRPPDADQHWTVLADPDGLQLCVFGPRPTGPAPLGPFELVVDAVDPLAIATWWGERTGATVHHTEDGPWVWLEGTAGLPFEYWVFNPVPEPKVVKNRVHWDVTLADADVSALVAAGATVLRPADDEVRWTVLADPEGNEFCVFA